MGYRSFTFATRTPWSIRRTPVRTEYSRSTHHRSIKGRREYRLMSQAPISSAPTIELLAPAGDLTCLQAAVENGADAVYFGLDRGFNARERATNFCLENLAEVMQTLRRRRVKGYVTLNTLVFSDELSKFRSGCSCGCPSRRRCSPGPGPGGCRADSPHLPRCSDPRVYSDDADQCRVHCRRKRPRNPSVLSFLESCRSVRSPRLLSRRTCLLRSSFTVLFALPTRASA